MYPDVSVSDGKHLGALLKAGEEELGTPHLIRWCSRSSSLIVTHRGGRSNRWCLSVVFVRALHDESDVEDDEINL